MKYCVARKSTYFEIMSKSSADTPHVLFAGSEAWLAVAVSLWLTRGEGICVNVVHGVPTLRKHLPRSLEDISVVAMPQRNWGPQLRELLNASLFPGIPVILTSNQQPRSSQASSRMAQRGVEPDAQTFPFRLHPDNLERLPHLVRELHEVSKRRRMIWQEGLSQPNESRKELSEKELQVLALIARGYSNWAISRELKVSEKSVEAKLTSIYEKLSLQTDTKQLNLRVAAALHFYGLISGGGVTARRG